MNFPVPTPSDNHRHVVRTTSQQDFTTLLRTITYLYVNVKHCRTREQDGTDRSPSPVPLPGQQPPHKRSSAEYIRCPLKSGPTSPFRRSYSPLSGNGPERSGTENFCSVVAGGLPRGSRVNISGHTFREWPRQTKTRRQTESRPWPSAVCSRSTVSGCFRCDLSHLNDALPGRFRIVLARRKATLFVSREDAKKDPPSRNGTEGP